MLRVRRGIKQQEAKRRAERKTTSWDSKPTHVEQTQQLTWLILPSKCSVQSWAQRYLTFLLIPSHFRYPYYLPVLFLWTFLSCHPVFGRNSSVLSWEVRSVLLKTLSLHDLEEVKTPLELCKFQCTPVADVPWWHCECETPLGFSSSSAAAVTVPHLPELYEQLSGHLPSREESFP